jgi:hypothetical protein
MDSNGVCLKKEIIQHLLVTDRVQNWNLHYESYVKNPNVPEIELHITKWQCVSSASLPKRTIMLMIIYFYLDETCYHPVIWSKKHMSTNKIKNWFMCNIHVIGFSLLMIWS